MGTVDSKHSNINSKSAPTTGDQKTQIIFFDFEVFKHDWLMVAMIPSAEEEFVFINDPTALDKFYQEHSKDIWVGYNVRGYDQYILKAIISGINPKLVNDYIIVENKQGWAYSETFRHIELYIYDIMLFGKSLKKLEGFMGEMIKESSISFNLDRKLTTAELTETLEYCRHDVINTMKVFQLTKKDFDAQLLILKTFKLPIKNVSKTKAQLSAMLLEATKTTYHDGNDVLFNFPYKISKYKEVIDWYKDPKNRFNENSEKANKLNISISDVPHVFAWGGCHGAIPKYHSEGIIINMDVASLYPALMINFDLLSRSVPDRNKYRQMRDQRIELKKQKNPMQEALKLILNSTYGASLDKYNALYDPRNGRNTCLTGQILLLDLIEKLVGHWKLIQTNTDGLIGRVNRPSEVEKIKQICSEWESRTGLVLEFDIYNRIWQKDVNNYLIVNDAGKYKAKGAYVKDASDIDNDMPIVNRAIREYFLKGISPETTISQCNDLIDFQIISKIGSSYNHGTMAKVVDNPKFIEERSRKTTLKRLKELGVPPTILTDAIVIEERCLRCFASKDPNARGIFKQKDGGNPEKVASTPVRAFIDNDNVKGKKVPAHLDRQWYIDMALKRIKEFC